MIHRIRISLVWFRAARHFMWLGLWAIYDPDAVTEHVEAQYRGDRR